MGQPIGLEGVILPSIEKELRCIQNYGESVDILLGHEVNRKTLMDCLPQYHWIHFSCHSYVPPNPFLSFFQLHDNEQLKLVDLMNARLSNAELAFLSACHTAAVDIDNTPDEAINLAAALQFCGFRSVIGTLWSMADIDGPDVAADFYGYMFRHGSIGDFRDSAMALNHATRQMRKGGIPLDRWINFVHIGA
jgi:CHAT domain-containing protein